MRRLLTLGFLLIIPAVVGAEPHVQIVEPKPRPVYTRDLVSVYAAKAFAVDTLNRYPANTVNNVFSGTNNFTGLVTFGSAAGAANSINFGTANSCIQYEGTAEDTSEFNLCVGVIDADQNLTYSLSGAVLTMTLSSATALYTAAEIRSTSGGLTSTSGQIYSANANGFSTNANSRYFMGGSGTGPFIAYITALTPDATYLSTRDAVSDSIHIAQGSDVAFDFNNGRAGTADAGTPTLIIHSPDQVITEYLQAQAESTSGMGKIENIRAGDYVGGIKSNITEASAQAVVRLTSATTNAGGGTVFYTVSDSNGTDHIARTGSVKFQFVDKATVVTCTINTAQDAETEDGSQAAVSGGALTLTYTWTAVAGTSTCDLSINGASNAGTNTFDVTWNAQVTGNAAITVSQQ